MNLYEIPNICLGFIHNHISFLNNSKVFAGIIMIILNIGSKFITIQFSKSAEDFLKLTVTKYLLIFAMAWMGTRDIYVALILTILFIIFSEHLLNDESKFCCVPHKYRLLAKANLSESELDPLDETFVTEDQINNAIQILERAKQDKYKHKQRQLFSLFGNYTLMSNFP
jgi:hypothetical protein